MLDSNRRQPLSALVQEMESGLLDSFALPDLVSSIPSREWKRAWPIVLSAFGAGFH